MDGRVLEALGELENLVRRLRGVDRRSVPAEVVRAIGLLRGAIGDIALMEIFGPPPAAGSDQIAEPVDGGELCDSD